MSPSLTCTALAVSLSVILPSPAPAQNFANPERVTINGYDGDAMEPFMSRDGRYLFFNNLNEPQVNTNLFYAERLDDLHFQFRGELQGVNTPALEGVASLDTLGNFYFVSNRSYDSTASTLYRGHFAAGAITDVELVPGISLAKPGIVNFDAEISADGNTLYFVESQFGAHGPRSASILLAHRSGNAFVRDPASADLMRTINAEGLNYAPALTANELEIFFTRAGPTGLGIYQASRAHTSDRFGPATRIAAIVGFVEAPSVSPDGKALYFHKKDDGHFVLYRLTRTGSPAPKP